jgi:hypothetical protein
MSGHEPLRLNGLIVDHAQYPVIPLRYPAEGMSQHGHWVPVADITDVSPTV